MTSQSDRIQSLVEQINSILSDSSASDSEMASEYQVLEQTRQQLTQLQQSPGNAQSSLQTVSDGSQLAVNDWQTPAPVLAESAQQVLQSIVQEMAYLRMNTVQPLREEITRLQQERSYLATEVQQLQQQRQQLILAQQTDQQQMINGFLHALMGRLQEQLTHQVAQTMVSLSGDTTVPLVSASNEQVVQLDSTLKVLFDSLQASVDTYQDSLEHSLRKMHGLGQQGEAMFTAFVNRLAGQLGREASLHLRPASSPDLDLPSEEVTASLEESTDPIPGLISSDPKDEIAPDYLDQLLEKTVEDPVDQSPSVDPTSPSGLDESAVPPPSNPQTLLTPDAVSTPEPESNPAANDMLDQIIDQLENNTIDAVEALDNLDLGFGLDELELADVPINSVADDSADDSIQALEQDVLNQLRQDPIHQFDQESTTEAPANPINLSSGLELDMPLEMAANIRMDEDESDVDRFMDALNQPQDDQPTTFAPGLMGIDDPEQTISNHPLLSDRPSSDLSIMDIPSSSQFQAGYTQSVEAVQDEAPVSGLSTRMDGGIADVSQSELQMDDTVRDSDDDSEFLLQQLSAELYDDVLGEEFLDAPSSSGDPLSSSPSINRQDNPGISFLINAPAAPPTPLENNADDAADTGSVPESTVANNLSQDLYSSFTDDNSTLVEIPTSDSDFEGLGGIDRLSDLDDLSGEGTNESEDNNTWSEWTNHLGEEKEKQDSGIDLEPSPQAFSTEPTTASTPVVDTIHSLRDLIEETGIASRPPVSFTDSDSSDLAHPNNEGNDDAAYRSPSVDLFPGLNTESPGETGLQNDDLSDDGGAWGALGNPDPRLSSALDAQTQREAEILAGLDLRLDANTMSELANDLSEMDDSSLGEYGEEDGLSSFGNDMANSIPLPPPLNRAPSEPLSTEVDGSSLDRSSLEPDDLDNPDDNAIEALQGLFSNGEESTEGQWDSSPEPPATDMQEFFADSVLSSSGSSPEPSSPQHQDNKDLFGALDNDEQETGTSDAEDLTPVSWTLDELISNDLSSSSSSTTPTEKPIINSPSQTSFDIESDFGDEFEDDGLVNLMNDLQGDDEPDNGPLSGVEEAKTLADLLRSQNSTSKPSSEDSAGFSSPFTGWFEDEPEESDDLSDQEKKNNY